MADRIEFPEVLEMNPFLPPAVASHAAVPTAYRLTAVLMHTGSSANSGHYTARILDQVIAV